MQNLVQDTVTSYTHAQTVLSGTTMEPLFLNGSLRRGQMRVIPVTGGSCTVEVSISGARRVMADTASWITLGTYDKDSLIPLVLPLSAVRVTAISEDVVVEVLAVSY